ncbi:MAG TPA: hypothetical protein VG389_27210 [Myxococcota bacterium]|jgi:hypothetical protein|nr:hypothetical protein [Myxococcota bacterium]
MRPPLAPARATTAALLALLPLLLPGCFSCLHVGAGLDDAGEGVDGSPLGCDFDGLCEPGEDCPGCPSDCVCTGVCGDGVCDPLGGESCDNCPDDCGGCGFCGDAFCDDAAGEDCTSCQNDCGACGPYCGNDLCEPGESCSDCARECLCLSPGLHQLFAGSPDLAGTVLRFTPDVGGYFESWACITALPLSPGSTPGSYVLSLASDDDAPMIAFPFGFPFFGTTQSTAWVSANGYLTFYGPDTAAAPSVAAHYAMPRIAPLFRDLSGGAIVVDDPPGELVVSWVGWNDGAGGLATFQASLDPSGGIELAYASDLDASGGLTGLSDGSGMIGTALDLAPGTCGAAFGSPGVYEQFYAANDLDGAQISYLWTGSGYVVYATTGNTVLPESPGAGSLSLSDDGNAEVSAAGGVQLYGALYGTLWVNANGDVTFDGPSATYSESAVEHFSHPRVSLLLDDLNPEVGGSIYYSDNGDHVTVTFLDVSEYAASNSNTFQMQLYGDGNVVVTYLAIDAADGLAGISDGNPMGLPLPPPIDLVP